MNNISNLIKKEIPTPPAFMATTRQKIYLMQHHLPTKDNMYIKHPRTMNALHSIGNVVRGVLNLTK